MTVVTETATDWRSIIAEVKRERPRATIRRYREYAERFKFAIDHPDEDASLTFIEEPGEPPSVMLMATGGPSSYRGRPRARQLKEIVRRAFCRLVIMKMHKRGIEVSFGVA